MRLLGLLLLIFTCGCPVGVEPSHKKPLPPINVVTGDKWVITLEETADRAKHLEQSAVIADLKTWNSLKAAGTIKQAIHYDVDDPQAAGLKAKLGAVTPPALFVCVKQPTGLKVVKVVPVPSSTSDIAGLLK